MEPSYVRIVDPLEPNLFFEMGEGLGTFRIAVRVKRTLSNRFKYWMFFKFFPFRLVKWNPLTR